MFRHCERALVNPTLLHRARSVVAFLLSLWLVSLVVFAPIFIPTHGEEQSFQQHGVRRQLTTALKRISDPVNELVASGGLERLHRGTYRVISPLADGSGDSVIFAFKAECRPASLWHGQQGWAEVAVYHFRQLFYDGDDVDYPRTEPARGVVVAITEDQLLSVVDGDRCGLLTETNTVKLEKALNGTKVLHGAGRGGGQGNSDAVVLLIGVALTWCDKYDDKVYPQAAVYAPYFAVPPLGRKVELHPVHRFELYEMSDVFVFDYLMLNPDRFHSKNWFRDIATRQHPALMDNGWAFAGENYKLPVCAVNSTLLHCPSPLLRWGTERQSPWRCMSAPHPVGASTAAPSKSNLLKWCRFRPKTLMALARTRAKWCEWRNPEEGALSRRWMDRLRSDVLMAFLLHTYGEMTSLGGKSMALDRHIHGCSAMGKGCDDPVAPLPSILRLLGTGVLARMDKLAAHAEQCLQDYGKDYVFAFEVND